MKSMQDVHTEELAQLDLNGLVVLDALLATRNVTQAAERLRLSQSATSHALARLRVSLGDALLVRGPGGLIPTVRAQALAAPLRAALSAVRVAVAPPRAFDPRTAKQRFVIATADYSELVMLPALSGRVTAQAPGVDLVLHDYDHDLADPLARGQYDAAIALVRPENDRPGLRSHVLFDERFVCVVRKGHPVIGKRWTPERFAALDHALIAPSGRPGGAVDDALARLGLTRRVAVLVQHFLVAPFLVAQTDLVLTLPERLARTFAQQLPLELLEPPLEVPGFSMTLLWHERSHDDPAHAWLRARIVEVGRELAGQGPRRRRSPPSAR